MVVVLTVANLNTLPRQYDVLLRFGADASWSEAFYSLDEYLESEHPRHVVALQLGVFTQLQFLSEDRLPVRETPQPHRDPRDPIETLEEWIPRPGSLLHV